MEEMRTTATARAGKVVGAGFALVMALSVPFPVRGQSMSVSDVKSLQDEAIRAEGAGQWDEAVRLHRLLTVYGPRQSNLWTRIADIEFRRGNTNEGLAALERAVSATPSDASGHARLSQSYAMAGRAKDALASMESALLLVPDDAGYLQSRAELANWVGKPDLAAESCGRILELRPDEPKALLTLARTRTWQGELDRAARTYRRYLGRYRDQPEPWIEYIHVEAWRGNFDKARTLLDTYEKRFGDRALVDRERARILASADKPRASMDLNDPLLKRTPGDFELNFTRAVALHYNHEPREAAEAVGILAKIRPDSAEVTGIRGFIETPDRPDLCLGCRFYTDSDDLEIQHVLLRCGAPLTSETRLRAGVDVSHLAARTNSGLENVDGSESVGYQKVSVGIRHVFRPSLLFDVSAGYAQIKDEGDDTFVYEVELSGRPSDDLRIKLIADYDFLIISPRSASLSVKRRGSEVEMQWEPGLLYTIVGAAKFDALSDGNGYTEFTIAPRMSILRSERFNVDIGARGMRSGYREDPGSGYYAPEMYQQYAATTFVYWKFSPDTGLGLVGTAGYHRDETMNDFNFGWSADAELTVGAFCDWMLRISGHAVENLSRPPGDSFSAYAGSASLTRRF